MKIGCDPELFVRQNGTLISAHGMIPGTKADPYRVTDGAVQVDGTAVEFNINPAEDYRTFERHIRSVMSDLTDLLKTAHKDNELFCVSSVRYPREYFNTIPVWARELGCDPDFDAYACIARVIPTDAEDDTLRTAAGHVHIGWGDGFNPDSEDQFVKSVKMTRLLDLTLNPKLEPIEDNLTRRELYGMPGTFRPKTYGVEYRTPSNQWLKAKEYMRLVYDECMRTAETLVNKGWDFEQAGRELTNG